jgi:hypothetical protein
MTLTLHPVYYAAVAVATIWLTLLWCARFKNSRRRRVAVALSGVAAVCLLLVPIGGLPLWSRAHSLFPNPSLPFAGIVGAALWRQLSGKALFNAADWGAVWLFGAVTGTALYLQSIIYGAVDLYYWGWDRESSAWALALLAILLLACGSRLGVLLVVALLAFAADVLESQNCWNYIVDPIFWLLSLGAWAARGCGWITSAISRRIGARLRERQGGRTRAEPYPV